MIGSDIEIEKLVFVLLLNHRIAWFTVEKHFFKRRIVM